MLKNDDVLHYDMFRAYVKCFLYILFIVFLFSCGFVVAFAVAFVVADVVAFVVANVVAPVFASVPKKISIKRCQDKFAVLVELKGCDF